MITWIDNSIIQEADKKKRDGYWKGIFLIIINKGKNIYSESPVKYTLYILGLITTIKYNTIKNKKILLTVAKGLE